MARPRRKWRLFAPVFAMVLILGACGDDGDGTATDTTDAGGDKQTIAFAFVGPLTGPNAALGVNIQNGAKVALDKANEESDEYNFVLKPFDTQGDPAQATTLKDKFIDDAQVLGVIGPTFSGETRAVIPDLHTEQMVMVSASATATNLPETVPGSPVFHRLVPDDDAQGAAVTQYVTDVLKAKTAAYVHDNSDYGKGLAEGTKGLLEKAGVRTVASDVIDPKAESYAAAVTKVAQAKPDIVFYGGYYSEAGKFKKQLTDEGVTAKFVSGDGTLDLGFVRSAGAAGAEGSHLTCACRLATEDAEGELGQFAKDYKELNKVDAGTYSTQGFDAANILIDGVEEGNTTRAELLEYVEGLTTYDGVAGEIEFETNGNVKSKAVYAYEVKGGKLEELGTVEELVK